jgi:hypothetical protein
MKTSRHPALPFVYAGLFAVFALFISASVCMLGYWRELPVVAICDSQHCRTAFVVKSDIRRLRGPRAASSFYPKDSFNFSKTYDLFKQNGMIKIPGVYQFLFHWRCPFEEVGVAPRKYSPEEEIFEARFCMQKSSLERMEGESIESLRRQWKVKFLFNYSLYPLLLVFLLVGPELLLRIMRKRKMMKQVLFLGFFACLVAIIFVFQFLIGLDPGYLHLFVVLLFFHGVRFCSDSTTPSEAEF